MSRICTALLALSFTELSICTVVFWYSDYELSQNIYSQMSFYIKKSPHSIFQLVCHFALIKLKQHPPLSPKFIYSRSELQI